MANKQWPRWVAAVAALAMAGSLPGTALAAPAQGDAASTTPTLSTGNLKSKVSSQLQQAKGEVTAFIQTTSPSALERKNSVLKNFSRQRSALPTLKQRAQSAQAATQSAKTAEKTSVNVFSQLQSLDSSAKKIYSTSYALSGVAVRADAASLRKLAEQSGSVAHITILTPKKALDTTNGSGEAPANKNNDQLVNAVKTWEQTGKTGKGVNIAVVDTGLDYTHADFGGAGTTEAYQTALNSTADPLTDPKVSKLLDKTKFKGGYDYAGATYNPNAGNNNPTPDANPIDGQGGHHGTHVAGTALGYGVKADGTSGKTDTAGYQKLTAGDIASWKIGPGAAPEAGIYSYKVFGDNGGTTDLVLEALDGIAKHNTEAEVNGDESSRISIVSMSLGGSFGASDDPENVAVDNLTADNVLSVIAAGNDGDITDIMGAPGTAKSALTVAASQSGKALQDAVEVTAGPASLKGQTLAGQYSVNYAKLDDFSLTGKVVRVKDKDNLEGCKAYSADDAAAVKGNIAYVEWNDAAVNCGSKTRFDNAEKAGATGILFGSQANIPESGIGGNADIPGFQLVKNAAENKDLQSAIDDGTLTVTLSTKLRMSKDADYSSESEDTIASFTSRGIHGSYDGTAKPDVSAPGVGIVSASAGTGNSDEIMSGTSMATPLTSGVAALVRQARPEYLANVVKAQLMNTANHDVLTADRKTAYGPLRVGSGRIDALAAVNNNVQLAGEDNEAITAQFGVIPVGKDGYTDKQTMRLVNNTDHDITYKLTYSARTPVPGVTYSVSGDNGGDTVVAKSGTSTSFRVKISIDQSKLTRTRDATQSAQVAGKDRQYVTDASGIITATPVTQEDDATTLRVPVTSVPKAISETTTGLSGFNNKKGTLSVSGHGLDQGDTATGYHSELVPFVYGAEDPVDGYTGNGDAARSLAAGDIRAIGYSSTAPQLSDPSQGLLSFGIITDKTWSHLGNNFVPDVIFDVDGDMKADYMISVSTTEGNTQYDTAWATTTSATTGKVVDEEPLDPAYVSDSNQVVLSVKLSALGFTKDTKVAPIAYMAQIESIYAAGAKDQYIVDTAGGSKDDSFDAYHPALWFGDSATEGNGTVSFPDENGTKVAVHTADDSSETAPKVLALHKNGFFPNIETDEPVIDAHTVKNIDKALLETLVFAASKYQESNYTADSWAAFKKAFDAAKKVLDSDTATQQQVNDAYTALRTAINGLVNATAKPSKDKLKAAVDAAAKLKESDYTADSWAAFVKALDAAKAVLANDNATQEEINNATGALFKAEEALVKKAGTPTKPGKPSQPGAPAKPGASGANSGQNGSNAGVAKTGAAVTGISGVVMLLLAAGATLVIIRRRDAVRR